MMKLSTHTRGFLITLLGVLLLTPDALLIRLIDIDVWTMLFWRGILMPIATLLLFIACYRRDTMTVIMEIGRLGLFVALLNMIGSISFVTAITYTTVAKALVIIACTPIFAALFSVIFLKEHVDRATWLVIVASFIGISIVVSDHIGAVSGSLLGDVSGLLAAISMAGSFTLMRLGKTVNMVPAVAMGWFMGALLVWPFASPLSLVGSQISYMALLGLIVLPISFGLISLGPRYIPAPEVSLLMLLETVLGPFWIWVVVKEVPNLTTLTGGSIVVVSIAVYSAWRLWRSKRESLGLNLRESE